MFSRFLPKVGNRKRMETRMETSRKRTGVFRIYRWSWLAWCILARRKDLASTIGIRRHRNQFLGLSLFLSGFWSGPKTLKVFRTYQTRSEKSGNPFSYFSDFPDHFPCFICGGLMKDSIGITDKLVKRRLTLSRLGSPWRNDCHTRWPHQSPGLHVPVSSATK